eukprot:TRINITY_DN1987_c0_g1_i2.p1 TRINITY_DN1987_c0_g1~~TRINITY_DN1987_c0_g1_i2.p1  ORF type:complete len:283 (-),score=45.70 TRINITY_DN1987_c0_g1_i2:572-1300(-)
MSYRRSASLEKLREVDDVRFVTSVEHALAVCDESVDTYGLDKLAFAFNGGKDSTVLLYLLLWAVDRGSWAGRREVDAESPLRKMKVIYFKHADAFDEVDDFVTETCTKFNLEAVVYECGFKEGLRHMRQTTNVQGIFMGTRRGDPHASDLDFYSPTTEGWPHFIRINPILEWTYSDVWKYLHLFEIPYCHLYNSGYTSIGGKHDTQPNPALKQENSDFHHAALLLDEALERAGRIERRRSHQ